MYTQLLVTVGPSTIKKNILEKLLDIGVRNFRFNFKHNSVEWHSQHILNLRHLAQRRGIHVNVMLDLQGPSVRVKLADANTSIKIEPGTIYSLVKEIKNPNDISVTHPQVFSHLKDGNVIYMNEGRLKFILEITDKLEYLLHPEVKGVLRNGVSFNVEGVTFTKLPVLTKRDLKGLDLAAAGLVDTLAISFVRGAKDLVTVKEQLRRLNVVGVGLVSKIETTAAVERLEEIIDESDVIMIARGDLALETPFYKVPTLQKEIIAAARGSSVPVIVATQMLESMIKNPFPTRAEISDVGNAVYDKADVLMLSGETAIGEYPVLAVETMVKIAEYVESHPVKCHFDIPYSVKTQKQRLIASVAELIKEYTRERGSNSKVFVILFAHDLGIINDFVRYRIQVPSAVFWKGNPSGFNRLFLRYGIKHAFLLQQSFDTEHLFVNYAIKRVKDNGVLRPNTNVIVIFDEKILPKTRAARLRIFRV